MRRTARTVVVPASMGLGLSSTACNGNGLRHAGDAGLEAGKTQADAPVTKPDLAVDTVKYDMPMMMVPYLIAMAPDAAPDTAPDADSDVLLDARTDISSPPPPYLAPPPPDAAAPWTREAGVDARPDVRAEVRFPEPPYLLPAMIDVPPLGPRPPAKK